MVVGDRGLVIRAFAARLGGEEQRSPSFSVLCDKLELGPPAHLGELLPGDAAGGHAARRGLEETAGEAGDHSNSMIT